MTSPSAPVSYTHLNSKESQTKYYLYYISDIVIWEESKDLGKLSYLDRANKEVD